MVPRKQCSYIGKRRFLTEFQAENIVLSRFQFQRKRKNSLFANTPRGTQGSAIIYNLVESAKENRLDPFKYLVHVLSAAQKIDLSQKDSVDLLLPENAPAECSVNFKK